MQITNTVGNSYNIVAKCVVKGPMLEKNNCIVYQVADVKTGRIVGYVGCGRYDDICVYGPLSNEQDCAQYLAYQCAYNRYRARVKAAAHSNTR